MTTGIEWTDETWNPLVGCSVVSPGCTNCYAMRKAGGFLSRTGKFRGLTLGSKAGPVWTGEVRLWEPALDQPLRWQKPRRIFVNSMSDLFHESIPSDWIRRIFDVMRNAPQHTYQILTKRAERMKEFMAWWVMQHVEQPPSNWWLGVSVEDQARADERIPLLLETPAAVRWISAEPLLGPVEMSRWLGNAPEEAGICEGPGIDWVVVGGESGPHARPMHPDWARSLRDQCTAAGVPFFFKQWGEWAPAPDDGFGHRMVRLGRRSAGRLVDGRSWDELPPALHGRAGRQR